MIRKEKSKRWIGKDLEGDACGLFEITILVFHFEDQENPMSVIFHDSR
jgi:hypothetical protein